MNPTYATYLIAGMSAIGVAVATLLYRRVRETSRIRRLASRLGWSVRLRGRDAVLARAGALSLMRIGHSRRIGALFEPRPGVLAFSYSYETGTEIDRMTHSWRVVLCDVDCPLRWSILTDQDWLIAAARVRRMRSFDLAPFAEADAIRSPHAFMTDDPDDWRDKMTPRLAAFLTQQSRERSWEISPGMVAAFEPGAFLESEMAAMVDQTSRLSQLLLTAFGAAEDSVASADASSLPSSVASATELAG
ncbi:MAG TPA: hypothetical protein P5081_07695 [Phycisphaerae bacterium]|nr:hypothetical protein [Phycisphaerae bacterium]HRW52754.1 hypothetical protein [Phycisphaerae bacterium]